MTKSRQYRPAAAALLLTALAALAPAAQSAEMLTKPFLQYVHPTGITIMWEVDADAEAVLKYGTEAPHTQATGSKKPSGHGSFIYKCVLDGLKPDTVYTYAVTLDESEPFAGDFRTAPAEPRPFSFGVWSDSQGTNHGEYKEDLFEPTKSMMRDMANSGVAFAVGAGDLAEDGAKYVDTRHFYLDRVAKYLGREAPYFIAWGNHDAGPGAILREFADLPSKTREGKGPGFGSYSFDYGGCHFICIDYATQAEDLAAWLEQDLKSPANQHAKFTFLFIHVPPYCELWIDGDETLRVDLVPLMEKYGVDICFSGHTHEYERGYFNGVFYVVTGGGSWLDFGEPLITDWPHITVGGYQNLRGRDKGLVNEYVQVHVGENDWKVEMVAFEADGSRIGVMDTFTSRTPAEQKQEQEVAPPLVHAVYFWLRDGITEAQRQDFLDAVRSLRKIGGIKKLYLGEPPEADRDIVEDSYDYGLTVVFKDAAALNAYLPHPVHRKFVDEYASYWERVKVFDTQ